MFGDRSACHIDVVDPTEAWLAATHKCCRLKGSLQHFGEFL